MSNAHEPVRAVEAKNRSDLHVTENGNETMKAVIFKEPHKVALEDRPIPKIKAATDIIVKVIYTALCGSELHVFRVRLTFKPFIA